MSTSSLIRARSLNLQQPRTRQPLPLGRFLFWFLFLSAGAVFCLWTCLGVRTEAREIAKLKKEMSELRLINHELKGEVARLESPARVEMIARNQLGLVYPEPSQVVQLLRKEDTKLTMARP